MRTIDREYIHRRRAGNLDDCGAFRVSADHLYLSLARRYVEVIRIDYPPVTALSTLTAIARASAVPRAIASRMDMPKIR